MTKTSKNTTKNAKNTGTKKKASNKKTNSKSKILESVYEAAQDMHEIGVITTVTMRKFESLCKKPVQEMSASEIKSLRLRERVSQPVFAWYLNVQPTTVQKWENGENSPSGPALRLLNVIEQHGLNHISQ